MAAIGTEEEHPDTLPLSTSTNPPAPPTSLNRPDPDAINIIPSHSGPTTPPTTLRTTPDRTTPAAAASSKSFSLPKRIFNFLKRSFARQPYYENWEREISVESTLPPHNCRKGVATFDPICDPNLISPEYAKTLGLHVDPYNGPPISRTIKGETVHCIGKVSVRWYCDQKRIPAKNRFNTPRKYELIDFLVTDADDCFDVIIGLHTIEELGIFDPSRRFIACFRNVPPKVESLSQEEEAKIKETRKKELAAMFSDTEQKDQNGKKK